MVAEVVCSQVRPCRPDTARQASGKQRPGTAAPLKGARVPIALQLHADCNRVINPRRPCELDGIFLPIDERIENCRLYSIVRYTVHGFSWQPTILM